MRVVLALGGISVSDAVVHLLEAVHHGLMGRLYTFLLLYLAVAFLQNLYIDLVAIFTAKIHLFINLIDFRLLNDDIFDL